MKTLLAMVLLSCASFAQNEEAITKARTACGPDNIKFDVEVVDSNGRLAAPEAGKALVYIIAQDVIIDQCYNTCGILARIGLDGAWVGAIREESHMHFSLAPGEHHLCANWQSRLGARNKRVALAGFTAEAGKVYFFRLRLVEGSRDILDLDLLNNDQGQYLVAASRLSESQPQKP